MLSPQSCVLLSCLFHNSNLPPDIQRDIVWRFEKNLRRENGFNTFGRGLSRGAVKRRAKNVGRCWKCGALIHDRACKDMPTYSQSECASALREDPVMLKVDKVLRKNSNASAMVDELVSLRLSKLRPNYL